MNNNEFFQNLNMDSNVTGNNNYVNQDMEVDVNMNNYGSTMNNVSQSEGVRERVINRTFVHEVPQDCSFMIEK